jgi:predicted amidohydrolase
LSDFLLAAVDLIRNRAARARGTKDYEIVELAAYLFAIGCELLVEERSARMRRRAHRQTLGESLDEALRGLAALPGEITAPGLYWTVIDALLVLENEICRRYADVEALPGMTELEEIRAGKCRALGGEVYHWIHPPSALASHREKRYQEGRRLTPDPEPHPGTHLTRLGLYWHSDRQLPRLDWFRKGERNIPLLEESGLDAAHRKSFRIALCSLPEDLHPRFEVLPEGGLFRADDRGIADPAALAAHLEGLLAAAAEQDVHLLLLPELMVDPMGRQLLRDRLAAYRSSLLPYGVVPGSFHVRSCGDAEPCVNEAVFLDRTGALLATHWKRGRFRIPSSVVKAFPKLFSKAHPKPEEYLFEDIRDGNELHIVETSLGRLALLICADAIAADDKGYLPVIRRLRPDLLFVLSMSPETEPFERFFKDMAAHWIGTIFVNAHCICRLGKVPPHLAACDLALFEPRGEAPTRVRWIYGQEEPECIYYNPVDGNRGWRPLPKPSEPTGVSLLQRGPDVLGLVLDLGVHWRKQQGNR